MKCKAVQWSGCFACAVFFTGTRNQIFLFKVLSWLAKGQTNRDIGDILQLSPRTVSTHLEQFFEKMG